jgi:hypothetical protein
MPEEASERYPVWTGEDCPTLRENRRELLRELAEHLNRNDRAISEWEAAGRARRKPRVCFLGRGVSGRRSHPHRTTYTSPFLGEDEATD